MARKSRTGPANTINGSESNHSSRLRLLHIAVHDEDSLVVAGRVCRLHEESLIPRVVCHRRADQFLAIGESDLDTLPRKWGGAGALRVSLVSGKILDEKQGL